MRSPAPLQIVAANTSVLAVPPGPCDVSECVEAAKEKLRFPPAPRLAHLGVYFTPCWGEILCSWQFFPLQTVDKNLPASPALCPARSLGVCTVEVCLLCPWVASPDLKNSYAANTLR